MNSYDIHMFLRYFSLFIFFWYSRIFNSTVPRKTIFHILFCVTFVSVPALVLLPQVSTASSAPRKEKSLYAAIDQQWTCTTRTCWKVMMRRRLPILWCPRQVKIWWVYPLMLRCASIQRSMYCPCSPSPCPKALGLSPVSQLKLQMITFAFAIGRPDPIGVINTRWGRRRGPVEGTGGSPTTR